MGSACPSWGESPSPPGQSGGPCPPGDPDPVQQERWERLKSHLGTLVPGKFAPSHRTQHLRGSGRGVGWADTLLGSGRAKGHRLCCRSLGFPGGGGGASLVPVKVCVGFGNLIFQRALKMLTFKVTYTWQNVAFSLEGKKA